MSTAKNRRVSMPNIPVAPPAGKMTGSGRKSSDTLENLMACRENGLEGEARGRLWGGSDYCCMLRKADRFRTKGIVALTSLEKPVVSNIYDIAPGGVSFLHTTEADVSTSEFKMDILIYDSQTGFEYFVSQVRGRVVDKELVTDPVNNARVWRFNVKFFDLDPSLKSKLHALCNLEQTTSVRFMDERLPKISYDL